MLPSPSHSSIGTPEDTTWADVESLSIFQPDVEESRATMPSANDACSAEASELNDRLENWLETFSPEESAIFMEQMNRMRETEELNLVCSSSHDANGRNLAAFCNNTTGHQPLQDASIFTNPPDAKPSPCQLVAAQISEQFLTLEQTFVKPDPAELLDSNNFNISSFSESPFLQPVSPTRVLEEMMFISDDYIPQCNNQHQEELASQRLNATSIEKISYAAGPGNYNNNLQCSMNNGAWRTGSNSCSAGSNLRGLPMNSYEGEFGDVDVGEDRSQTEEDDDRQSCSPGSVRVGGRRYSSAEKKERRKEQNRRAATKCRNRKKAEFETFKEECERVKLENAKLRQQREKLRQLVRQLNERLSYLTQKPVLFRSEY